MFLSYPLPLRINDLTAGGANLQEVFLKTTKYLNLLPEFEIQSTTEWSQYLDLIPTALTFPWWCCQQGKQWGCPPSAMYLCPAKGASHTWPENIIGYCHWFYNSLYLCFYLNWNICFCIFNVHCSAVAFLSQQTYWPLSSPATGWNIIIWKSRRRTDKRFWNEDVFLPSSRNVSGGRPLPQRRCTRLRRSARRKHCTWMTERVRESWVQNY